MNKYVTGLSRVVVLHPNPAALLTTEPCPTDLELRGSTQLPLDLIRLLSEPQDRYVLWLSPHSVFTRACDVNQFYPVLYDRADVWAHSLQLGHRGPFKGSTHGQRQAPMRALQSLQGIMTYEWIRSSGDYGLPLAPGTLYRASDLSRLVRSVKPTYQTLDDFQVMGSEWIRQFRTDQTRMALPEHPILSMDPTPLSMDPTPLPMDPTLLSMDQTGPSITSSKVTPS